VLSHKDFDLFGQARRNEVGSFRYQCLVAGNRQIRLVKTTPCLGERTWVTCRLHVVNLDESSIYEAVSYFFNMSWREIRLEGSALRFSPTWQSCYVVFEIKDSKGLHICRLMRYAQQKGCFSSSHQPLHSNSRVKMTLSRQPSARWWTKWTGTRKVGPR